MDQVTKVFNNAVAPIDVRNGIQPLIGSVEYVAIEVAVSKIVRSVLKFENKGIMELAWIHLLSLPFMGGLGAPFGVPATVGQTANYTQAFKDGAKGIPAVLAAQWVIATAQKGFHFPWFSLRDLMITAGSKTISRPLTYAVIGKVAGLADPYAVIDQLIQRQASASTILRK